MRRLGSLTSSIRERQRGADPPPLPRDHAFGGQGHPRTFVRCGGRGRQIEFVAGTGGHDGGSRHQHRSTSRPPRRRGTAADVAASTRGRCYGTAWVIRDASEGVWTAPPSARSGSRELGGAVRCTGVTRSSYQRIRGKKRGLLLCGAKQPRGLETKLRARFENWRYTPGVSGRTRRWLGEHVFYQKAGLA